MIKGTKDNIDKVYDRIAEVAGTQFASSAELGLDEVKQFFEDLPSNSLILDTGPGKGIEAKIAIEMGHVVTGIDISSKMLDVFLETNPKATGVVGNITRIPDSLKDFDAIHSSCCILHLDKHSAVGALKEFRKVLKNEGKLFLVTTVSNGEEEDNVNEGLQNMGVESWYFYHWKSEELKQALEEIGFKVDSWHEKSLIQNRPDVAIVRATNIK